MGEGEPHYTVEDLLPYAIDLPYFQIHLRELKEKGANEVEISRTKRIIKAYIFMLRTVDITNIDALISHFDETPHNTLP